MAKKIEPVYAAVGERIRFARESRGMTQLELAKRIGIVQATLSAWEAGRARIMLHHIVQIAEILESSPEFLMKGVWDKR